MHSGDGHRDEDENAVLTLGDAVAAVSAVTADEREVVAVVAYMLRRRSIRWHGTGPDIRPWKR